MIKEMDTLKKDNIYIIKKKITNKILIILIKIRIKNNSFKMMINFNKILMIWILKMA